jgi:hypothetical protein
MRAGTLAGKTLGRGLAAGLAGTAAMTVSSTVEAKMRQRGASTTPAKAAEKMLGVEPKSEQAEQRLNNLTHWGYGTGWGVARGVIGAAGLREPWASMAHFGLIWGTALAMLPGMGLTSKPWEWGAEEVGIDAFHHIVYAVAAGLAYDALERW